MSTETADQRAERLLNEAVQRFRFEPFDVNGEDVEDYLERFEIQLDVVGLATPTDPTQDTDERRKAKRRTLLLSNVGKDTHAKLKDVFRPDALTTKTYAQLSTALKTMYKRKVNLLVERKAFMLHYRKEGETLHEFARELRRLSADCQFGDKLDERLRDQFVIGISNAKWQEELMSHFTTNDARFLAVFQAAELLEGASKDAQRLERLTRSETSGLLRKVNSGPKGGRPKQPFAPAASRLTDMKRSGPRQQFQLDRARQCARCGLERHSSTEMCAAKKVECAQCHNVGHFARCCLKTGRAVDITRKSVYSKQYSKLRAVNDDRSSDVDDEYCEFNLVDTECDPSPADDEECGDEGDDYNTAFVINSVTHISVVKDGKSPTKAMLSVIIEGKRVNMLYDPGASCTVIPERMWLQLGAPALSAIPPVYAYSDVPIVTLGSAQVWVEHDGRRLRLPVTVVKSQDAALFGFDWCRAWNMPLPKGVKLCTITPKPG